MSRCCIIYTESRTNEGQRNITQEIKKMKEIYRDTTDIWGTKFTEIWKQTEQSIIITKLRNGQEVQSGIFSNTDPRIVRMAAELEIDIEANIPDENENEKRIIELECKLDVAQKTSDNWREQARLWKQRSGI